MKKIATLLASTALLGAATFAYAQSGNSYADAWVAQLEAEGYANISVEIEQGEIEIEGTKNGEEREITLDEATGATLSDITEAEDEDTEAEDEDTDDENEPEDEDDDEDDDSDSTESEDEEGEDRDDD